jgi:hypothetical protein
MRMKFVFTPISLIAGLLAGLVKGLTDHGARRTFARATGAWPGEEAPE